MKNTLILFLTLVGITLSTEAQTTNIFGPFDFIFRVNRSTNLNAATVYVTPKGFDLLCRMSFNVLIRCPEDGAISNAEVTFGANLVRLFAASTNKPAFLRSNILNRISLTRDTNSVDPIVVEEP